MFIIVSTGMELDNIPINNGWQYFFTTFIPAQIVPNIFDMWHFHLCEIDIFALIWISLTIRMLSTFLCAYWHFAFLRPVHSFPLPVTAGNFYVLFFMSNLNILDINRLDIKTLNDALNVIFPIQLLSFSLSHVPFLNLINKF